MARSLGSAKTGLTVAPWVIACTLLVAVVARLVAPGTHAIIVGIQGVVVWALAPAYVLVVLALWRRQYALLTLSAVLAAIHMHWAAAEVATTGRQARPSGTVAIRLTTANGLLSNPSPARFAKAIMDQRPDLLTVQEFTPQQLTTFRDVGVLEAYPHALLHPLPGYFGSATFSKYPIEDSQILDVGGYPVAQVDIRTPAGLVRLVNVHVVAPLSAVGIQAWQRQTALLGLIQAPPRGYLVLAGDFNATIAHRPLANLIRSGLRDAWAEAGFGLGATWPAEGVPGIRLMRLDHVLLGSGVLAISSRRVESPGSDHDALVTDLGLRPWR